MKYVTFNLVKSLVLGAEAVSESNSYRVFQYSENLSSKRNSYPPSNSMVLSSRRRILLAGLTGI